MKKPYGKPGRSRPVSSFCWASRAWDFILALSPMYKNSMPRTTPLIPIPNLTSRVARVRYHWNAKPLPLMKRANITTPSRFLKNLALRAKSLRFPFIWGNPYWPQAKTERALAIFEKLVDQNGDFAPEARWYAALAALKLRDTAKVEDLLRKIIAVNGYRSAQARELLKRLE